MQNQPVKRNPRRDYSLDRKRGFGPRLNSMREDVMVANAFLLYYRHKREILKTIIVTEYDVSSGSDKDMPKYYIHTDNPATGIQ